MPESVYLAQTFVSIIFTDYFENFRVKGFYCCLVLYNLLIKFTVITNVLNDILIVVSEVTAIQTVLLFKNSVNLSINL